MCRASIESSRKIRSAASARSSRSTRAPAAMTSAGDTSAGGNWRTPRESSSTSEERYLRFSENSHAETEPAMKDLRSKGTSCTSRAAEKEAKSRTRACSSSSRSKTARECVWESNSAWDPSGRPRRKGSEGVQARGQDPCILQKSADAKSASDRETYDGNCASRWAV